jgi:hypothetical protein
VQVKEQSNLKQTTAEKNKENERLEDKDKSSQLETISQKLPKTLIFRNVLKKAQTKNQVLENVKIFLK